MADIGEGGGALGRDAIGGEGLEEFAEDVIDINLGDEIAGGLAMDGGVVEAEAFVTWMGGHGTEFAVGEFKGAKVVGCVGSFCHSGLLMENSPRIGKVLISIFYDKNR